MRKGFDPKQPRDRYGRWVNTVSAGPDIARLPASADMRIQSVLQSARESEIQGRHDEASRHLAHAHSLAVQHLGGGATRQGGLLNQIATARDRERGRAQQLRADIFSPEESEKVKAHIRERSFRALARGRRTTRVLTAAQEEAQIRGNQDRIEFEAKKELARRYLKDPESLTLGQRINAKDLVARGFGSEKSGPSVPQPEKNPGETREQRLARVNREMAAKRRRKPGPFNR